ncbi:MAG: hypothetical protein ACD_49C00029G0042 [uncultured bacterium (gcode 4)]|uniref:PPM-type phosphatase domain-containing protein n=1 Tax=uncultured bacterium (gcode 4) TaxID=1234023 RepID=K2BWK7_9BACT|nr:MAG: hypothetical protein ACD_49C00029G0042 [uncultured bacterium (gcode 4)]HBY74685.1 protein phosphatase [Candidatus Gracilibacteria bacterium]
MKEFECAKGSIIGRDHRRINKNNQDAYEVIEDDNYIIATVCDGCSDAQASEVGANIICRMLDAKMAEKIENLTFNLAYALDLDEVIRDFLEELRKECIKEIVRISSSLNKNYLVGIKDFFLATIVSVIVTREVSFAFSIGDGVIIINGEPYIIGPFPDNEPPYIAYGAVEPDRVRVAKELYRFKVVKVMPTSELKSILIGSDGVEDICDNEKSNIPGKNELVGPISQFWENDKFFSNSSLLGRKLNLMNADSTKIDWEEKRVQREQGLLQDDTTMVVIRRR